MNATSLDSPTKTATFLLALGFWLLLSTSAGANPMLYRFEGRGFGTVGATPFNGSFVVEMIGDSGDIQDTSSSSQIGRSLAGFSTIELPGLGATHFTATMNIFISESRFFDISDIGMGVTFPDDSRKAIFELTGTELFGYRLDTEFGPFFDPSANLISQFNGVPTGLGDLEFDSMINITFTATAVPEPSTAWLIAMGLGFLSAYCRQARRCS